MALIKLGSKTFEQVTECFHKHSTKIFLHIGISNFFHIIDNYCCLVSVWLVSQNLISFANRQINRSSKGFAEDYLGLSNVKGTK